MDKKTHDFPSSLSGIARQVAIIQFSETLRMELKNVPPSKIKAILNKDGNICNYVLGGNPLLSHWGMLKYHLKGGIGTKDMDEPRSVEILSVNRCLDAPLLTWKTGHHQTTITCTDCMTTFSCTGRDNLYNKLALLMLKQIVPSIVEFEMFYTTEQNLGTVAICRNLLSKNQSPKKNIDLGFIIMSGLDTRLAWEQGQTEGLNAYSRRVMGHFFNRFIPNLRNAAKAVSDL